MNFNDVAIVSIREDDYRIHFWYMSKADGIGIMNISDLNEKKEFYNFFSLYIKNEWNNFLSKKLRSDFKYRKILLCKKQRGIKTENKK